MPGELRFTTGQTVPTPWTSAGHYREPRGVRPQQSQQAEQIEAQGEEAREAEIRHAHDISRRQRVIDGIKRWMKPVAVATALAFTVPAAVDPEEAEGLKRSNPVYPFVDFNQGDYGGRFPSQGCGPTSDAMIVATFKNNPRITPPVIGRQLPDRLWPSGMYLEGFHYIAQKHGIYSENSNLQEAKDVLWDGGLAAVHVKPGPWTSVGHYMVIKAVRSDGKFRLADPNDAPGRNTEKRWWSARELKRHGVGAVVTFTPSENMLMHTENMAAKLALGDVLAPATPAPVGEDPNHEFDLPG